MTNHSCVNRSVIVELENKVAELEARVAGLTKPERKPGPVGPREIWVNFWYDTVPGYSHSSRQAAEEHKGVGCIGTVRYVRAED